MSTFEERSPAAAAAYPAAAAAYPAEPDSCFMYTTDSDRNLFSKKTYKVGRILMNLIKQIPWNSYKFDGKTNVLMPVGDEEESFEYVEVDAEAHYDETYIPYLVFGGSCYEWLNSQKAEKDQLLDLLVDRTGDVDLRLFMPKITITHEHQFAIKYFYQDSKPNSLLQHLLDWITDKLSFIFTQSEMVMDDMIEYEPIEEEGPVIKRIAINNFLITQVVTGHMTKIQVSCKFKGMIHEDHILEFVLASGIDIPKEIDDMNRPDPESKLASFQIIDGLRIQSISALFYGNKNALLTGRTRDMTPKHKYYNHIQRLKYLNMYYYNDIPLEDITEYIWLFIILKGPADWNVFAIPLDESTDEIIKSQLYGNLLKRLNDKLEKIDFMPLLQLDQQIKYNFLNYKDFHDKFYVPYLNEHFKTPISIKDMVLYFNTYFNADIPDPLKRKKPNRCVVSGGRRNRKELDERRHLARTKKRKLCKYKKTKRKNREGTLRKLKKKSKI